MIQFQKLVQAQFDKMCATQKLFRSSLTGREVWKLYIESFTADPMFRDPNSSLHNCNLCNNFIKRYGNIIAIDDEFNVITMFDVTPSEEFLPVAQILSAKLKSLPIADVFLETYQELSFLPYEKCKKTNSKFQLGVAKNVKRYTKAEAELYGVVKPNEIKTFDHLHLFLPKQFVDMGTKSVEALMGNFRDDKNVFQRAMESISLDTYNLVKDLIVQGSLLDGQTHLYKVEQMIPLKEQFNIVYASSPEKANNWCWVKSHKLAFAKFRNELIGVLCSELAEGKEINDSCKSWNKRVDPANYMKAVAPITKKQIAEAQKFVEENGFTKSFTRRFATIDDIKVSEILHSNIGEGKIKSVSIFDDVKSNNSRHKRNEFKNIEEVGIEKFMKDLLPGCTSVEAFLTNQQEGNLVSLTTAAGDESKPIFKWDNNYSWTFKGNLAGKSQIKEAVKSKGGKVDGVLRFSIMWAEKNGDNSDLDAHCIEPDKHRIYFFDQKSRKTGGVLDVDITNPNSQMPDGAVENITYPLLTKMIDGNYLFRVNQYAGRKSRGFKAEIEFNGELYYYEYITPVRGTIDVATVSLKGGVFSIKHHLPETHSSKELYGLVTEQFHKVKLVCLSPNHWGENKIGNKHYMFMLDSCKSLEPIRSFHSENLLPKLAEHRKVLEVLGNTTMIAPADKQLSGLGFNATVKDELIVKLSGSHKRVVKIKF